MRQLYPFMTATTISIFLLTAANITAMAQPGQRKFRIARIEIDSAYLEPYKAALAENARESIEQEPGVLTLQAVFDKAHPTHVTVFEVYASEDAYQAHLKTAHFIKYKSGTLKWVKSLELVDVAPIAIAIKPSFVNQDHH